MKLSVSRVQDKIQQLESPIETHGSFDTELEEAVQQLSQGMTGAQAGELLRQQSGEYDDGSVNEYHRVDGGSGGEQYRSVVATSSQGLSQAQLQLRNILCGPCCSTVLQEGEWLQYLLLEQAQAGALKTREQRAIQEMARQRGVPKKDFGSQEGVGLDAVMDAGSQCVLLPSDSQRRLQMTKVLLLFESSRKKGTSIVAQRMVQRWHGKMVAAGLAAQMDEARHQYHFWQAEANQEAEASSQREARLEAEILALKAERHAMVLEMQEKSLECDDLKREVKVMQNHLDVARGVRHIGVIGEDRDVRVAMKHLPRVPKPKMLADAETQMGGAPPVMEDGACQAEATTCEGETNTNVWDLIGEHKGVNAVAETACTEIQVQPECKDFKGMAQPVTGDKGIETIRTITMETAMNTITKEYRDSCTFMPYDEEDDFVPTMVESSVNTESPSRWEAEVQATIEMCDVEAQAVALSTEQGVQVQTVPSDALLQIHALKVTIETDPMHLKQEGGRPGIESSSTVTPTSLYPTCNRDPVCFDRLRTTTTAPLSEAKRSKRCMKP